MEISKSLSSVLLAMIIAAATACSDGVLTDSSGVVYLTPWNADRVQPQLVEDRLPELDEERAGHYAEIRQGFETRAPTFFQSRQGIEFLGAIEQAFLLSGHYFDLVELVAAVYEEEGPQSLAAPVLAWTYLQLGQQPLVEEMLDELEEHRGDDPLTWVVVGSFHAERAGASTESALRARQAFERVLELDPEFDGFMAMEAELLRRQLEQLRRIAPPATAERTEEVADDDTAEIRAAARELAARMSDQVRGLAGEMERLDEEDADEEADDSDDFDDVTQARLYVARGQRALQSGRDGLTEAQQYFRRALEFDPESVDAGMGLLEVAARSGAPDEMLSEQVDRLADRELTARQAYDLGLFCLRTLKDRDRATSLLQRVQQKDPSLARRLGVDALLE